MIIENAKATCTECAWESHLEFNTESTITVPDAFEHTQETGHIVEFKGWVKKV